VCKWVDVGALEYLTCVVLTTLVNIAPFYLLLFVSSVTECHNPVGSCPVL